MKVMYKYSVINPTGYRPYSDSDSGITITASSSSSSFPSSNLKNIQPIKSWKSTSVASQQWVKYYFGGSSVTHNGLFLNRFNFSHFHVDISNDDVNWTNVADVSGLTTDELIDEQYMHYFIDLGTVSFKYIRVLIPVQTPLFETGYFKIGNMLVGTYVDIWNPKSGFRITPVPKFSDVEYPSGYTDRYVLGRTKRVFSGSFSKVELSEFSKIKTTYGEMVLYLDMLSDSNKVYLVRPSKDFETSYETENHNLLSKSFSFDEIV